MYWNTRADDLAVKATIGLMERNPDVPKDRIDDVAIAATTQIGDQGLTIGRTAALLAGLPQSVPGFAIDRMCAGALTAVTTASGGIAVGAYDVVVAGGVEHMGHHPMGEGVDPNGPMPRVVGIVQDQVRNAAIIISVGQELNVAPRGWVIAVATANEEVACAEGKLSELGAPPSDGRPSSSGRGRLTRSFTT